MEMRSGKTGIVILSFNPRVSQGGKLGPLLSYLPIMVPTLSIIKLSLGSKET